MPVPISRLLTLLFIPYYLFVLAMLLIGNRQNVDPVHAFIGIIAGATAVCVLLAFWSVDFADPERAGDKRFSLRSMMIVTGILAIHLAYFRLLPREWENDTRFDLGQTLPVLFEFIGFCLFSTFVLAMFTETVLLLAVSGKRLMAKWLDHSRSDVR